MKNYSRIISNNGKNIPQRSNPQVNNQTNLDLLSLLSYRGKNPSKLYKKDALDFCIRTGQIDSKTLSVIDTKLKIIDNFRIYLRNYDSDIYVEIREDVKKPVAKTFAIKIPLSKEKDISGSEYILFSSDRESEISNTLVYNKLSKIKSIFGDN